MAVRSCRCWVVPAILTMLGASVAVPADAAALRLVAAEDVYGDLVRQLGGPHVAVTSILQNPDQDPHLFEVSPSVARAVGGADLVVANGLGYDPWMTTLLAASPRAERRVVVVAALAGRHEGDNPHLWYDPSVMRNTATTLSALLARRDPADAPDYAVRLERTLAAIASVSARVAILHGQYAGTAVTATEPVFGYMASALGLDMRNERFQLAVMNDTEPAASDVAAMETDLRRHRVRLLLFNSQASDSAALRLEAVAARSGVPVVGVTETEPYGLDYAAWMLRQLDAVDRALSSRPS